MAAMKQHLPAAKQNQGRAPSGGRSEPRHLHLPPGGTHRVKGPHIIQVLAPGCDATNDNQRVAQYGGGMAATGTRASAICGSTKGVQQLCNAQPSVGNDSIADGDIWDCTLIHAIHPKNLKYHDTGCIHWQTRYFWCC